MPRMSQKSSKGVRDAERDRSTKQARSRLDLLAEVAVSFRRSGSPATHSNRPFSSSASETRTAQDTARHSPSPGPYSLNSHANSVHTSSSPAAFGGSSPLSALSETTPSPPPLVSSPLPTPSPPSAPSPPSMLNLPPVPEFLKGARENAARAALSPKVRHKVSEDVRRRNKADKAQRKRNRDVSDRVNLNNVLPVGRRASTKPPGLVEVMRKATEYIPEVQGDLEAAQKRIAELEDTNSMLASILTMGRQERDRVAATTERMVGLQNETHQLKSQAASG
ncbi:hypothetical protein EVG20_g6480 [Dentipellis fragilis]|uniref:Uncharacterized protein n=1 Tax=Dentipellis fragilis TaxID=205917 RepID=A0A4Y9YKX7_9AGAM|nr:hypothetical protein EVG20_g6480 [Dentipellis fragilis]